MVMRQWTTLKAKRVAELTASQSNTGQDHIDTDTERVEVALAQLVDTIMEEEEARDAEKKNAHPNDGMEREIAAGVRARAMEGLHGNNPSEDEEELTPTEPIVGQAFDGAGTDAEDGRTHDPFSGEELLPSARRQLNAGLAEAAAEAATRAKRQRRSTSNAAHDELLGPDGITRSLHQMAEIQAKVMESASERTSRDDMWKGKKLDLAQQQHHSKDVSSKEFEARAADRELERARISLAEQEVSIRKMQTALLQ
eukprot:jgi/Mesvir1/19775/Mv13075-RA.1